MACEIPLWRAGLRCGRSTRCLPAQRWVVDQGVSAPRRAGGELHLMDPKTFEHLTLDPALLGPQAAFLADGMLVTLQLHHNLPVAGNHLGYPASVCQMTACLDRVE